MTLSHRIQVFFFMTYRGLHHYGNEYNQSACMLLSPDRQVQPHGTHANRILVIPPRNPLILIEMNDLGPLPCLLSPTSRTTNRRRKHRGVPHRVQQNRLCFDVPRQWMPATIDSRQRLSAGCIFDYFGVPDIRAAKSVLRQKNSGHVPVPLRLITPMQKQYHGTLMHPRSS